MHAIVEVFNYLFYNLYSMIPQRNLIPLQNIVVIAEG